ncbi:MAG: NUDIX domain-containing protein [Candidatus Omnitrophica bacterium]|nr:NUDIX domain-containing protein [Candidatus Omnitrophota bacterium]
MNKEFSAGTVIFRKEKEKILYLVIYSKRNQIWGFPKGHIEPGESEKQTALRETEEETGLKDLNIINGFRIEDIYEATSNRGPSKGQTIEKHSIYFLCETNEKDIRVNSDEISEYRWLETEKAVPLLSFDSLRQILRKAESLISSEQP